MKKIMQNLTKSIMLVGIMAGIGSAHADEFINGFKAAEAHDYKQAAKKWETLAKQDNGNAQFMLGTMYHSGVNGAPDEKTAVALYKKAAENGYYGAQEYLAIGYKEGWFGLKKDPKKAAYWMKALEQNPSSYQ